MCKHLVHRLLIVVIGFLVLQHSAGNLCAQTPTPKSSMSILVLGIDSGDLDRDEQGRSDVIMVVTLNPTAQQVTLTSIPRDTYVPIAQTDMYDKLNHAFSFGGVDLTLKTINHWLESRIQHYVVVDLAGLKEIVNAVGGIEIIPPTSFEMDGIFFTEGEKMLLSGEEAVAYSRERYTSGGDYARQERQREIVMALVNKLNSTDVLLRLPQVLQKISSSLDTNMEMTEILSLFQEYRQLLSQVETFQLEGEGQLIDEVYYEVPFEASVNALKQRLKELD